MTLRPHPIEPVPDDTAEYARAALGPTNPYIRMRDRFERFYTDDQFTKLYPITGQPAFSPWRLALITILQFAEGLTDEQAAGAVASRMDWKYLWSLPLGHRGIDSSVLSEFRDRLVRHQASEQLLTNLVTRCKEEGVITPRGTQRTDSTHVLANIRVLNRLELVGQTLRAALEDAASTAPDWLRQVALPHWLDDYGPRFEEYRLPKEATKRQTLAEQIGADGRVLLAALQAADAPAGLRDRQAFRVLERIWEQEYGPDGRWRRNEDLPPGAQLLVSPYEQEARWSEKRGWVWVGYKAHLTETCTDDLPLLITHVETTHAAVPDDQGPGVRTAAGAGAGGAWPAEP